MPLPTSMLPFEFLDSERNKGLVMGRLVSNAGWKVSLPDSASAQNSYKVIATRQGTGTKPVF
ncbi:hypothetical protein MCEGEM3_01426 [Oxalobacteraceae bacterium]